MQLLKENRPNDGPGPRRYRSHDFGHGAAEVVTISIVRRSHLNAGSKAHEALQTGIATAPQRLIGLRTELDQTLTDDDPLWYALASSAPATPNARGAAKPDARPWSGGQRRGAGGFRSRAPCRTLPGNGRGRGGSRDGVALAARAESETVLYGIPTGKAISVSVTAVNDAGESQPSAPVTLQTP
ncbi:MAG TPA: hypothetical protein VF585_04450 [Chthoniobacterales bacterium]